MYLNLFRSVVDRQLVFSRLFVVCVLLFVSTTMHCVEVTLKVSDCLLGSVKDISPKSLTISCDHRNIFENIAED